ncbi:hypothetical protein [Streptomyces spiralis]|uniref:hypothetical protein n=1 Tax=Streptomyces spiralis TaxID=66376 RepID=UPI0036A628A9
MASDLVAETVAPVPTAPLALIHPVENTEDEVNDLLSDDDRDAGWSEDDACEWVR